VYLTEKVEKIKDLGDLGGNNSGNSLYGEHDTGRNRFAAGLIA